MDDACHAEVEEWRDWLGGATSEISADFVAEVRAFLPDIARAKDLVEQPSWRPGDRLSPVFTFRDVKPDNVLLTSASPELVDWDGAGLDFAEWELPRLWRALGHRPVTPAEQAAAHEHTLEFLAELRTSLDRLDQWACWLDPW